MFDINNIRLILSAYYQLNSKGWHICCVKKNELLFQIKYKMGINSDEYWYALYMKKRKRELPLASDVWEDTHIKITDDVRIWHNPITNQHLHLKNKLWIADMLEHFPVGLLIGKK